MATDDEWVSTSLGEVVNLKRGYDLPERDRTPGPFPIVSSSGVTGTHVEAKSQPPGVVTGRYGTLGSVHYITEPYWPLNTTLYVQDFKGNHPRFVSYLLEMLDLGELVASAAVPGINRNHLHPLRVRVPNSERQRMIAGALGAFDDLIENNRRRVEILEEMARLIYREWFVHFRFPSQEDVELVDSDLGLIPEGWSVSPLQAEAEARRGLSWDRELEAEDGVGVITIPNIGSELDTKPRKLLRGVPDEDLDRFSLCKGDVLMIGSNGNPERVGQTVWVSSDMSCVFASFLMRIRATSDLDPYLLFRHVSEGTFLQGLRSGAVGSTGLRNLRVTAVRDALFVRAPQALERRFVDTVRPMRDLQDALLQQSIILREARDLLLPRLVSGELDVSELALELAEMG